MSNVAFGKTLGNVRKYRHVQFVTTEARKNYLISEWNYHTTEKKTFWKPIGNKNEKNSNIYE